MAIILPAKRKFLAPPLVRTIDDRRDPLNLGLVGHWSMDAETISAKRVLDVSGRDNHGTYIGALTTFQIPGRVREAVQFNGIDTILDCGNSSSLNLTTNFSVSAWVWPLIMDASNRQIISKGYDGTNTQWNLYTIDAAGTLQFGIYTGAFHGVTSVAKLSTTRYRHVIGTYDGTTYRLYIDGVLDNSQVDTAPIATNQKVAIGAAFGLGNPIQFFNGFIDEVRVYNRALTPAEVFRLYNNPARDRVPYQTRGRVKGPTGAASITGTLAITEANDTIAAVGRVAVGGTLAVTEQADTINAAGAVRVAGTLSRTEANDTLSATGTVAALGAITGTLSALQAVQTLIATGLIRVSGGLNVTQAAQTLAAAGIVGSIVPPPSGQGVQVIIMS